MDRLLVEQPEDAYEVELLLDLTFAPGRLALSSYQLRDGVDPIAALCLVARDDYDVVVGAIRTWPVRIGARGWPALLLGPVAVHPVRQGEGLGALLIGEVLARAEREGWERVILVGDEPYYRRFGFHHDLARHLDYPQPVNFSRVLALELVPKAMEQVSGPVKRWHSAQ